jgi:N-dimethylarginine dimethylaminohydrolase
LASLHQEIGTIWSDCGVASEWSPLRAVLLHRPGDELRDLPDPDEAQMLDRIETDRAQEQHDALAAAYRNSGVRVYHVEPADAPPPNLMFVADLLFATPEGVILARPASTVRAGEERHVAARLAALGVPLLRMVRGRGTFEGADAAWLDAETVLLATGLRTNSEGAQQVTGLLREMGVEVIQVGLPYGAMHLMGTLRLADRDLAIAHPGRVPFAAVEALRERGFTVLLAPAYPEELKKGALNFVTLGPRRVLMPAGCPVSQRFYESVGIHCTTAPVDELIKAAGGIGCLTGVLARQ